MRRILLPDDCTSLATHQLARSLALRLRPALTSDNLDLGNSVAVTEDNTDLRRSGALLGQLADLLDNLVGGGLEPRGGVAAVGDSRG